MLKLVPGPQIFRRVCSGLNSWGREGYLLLHYNETRVHHVGRARSCMYSAVEYSTETMGASFIVAASTSDQIIHQLKPSDAVSGRSSACH